MNRWSLAAALFWKPIKVLQQNLDQPLRVLDIACGGGDVLCDLASRARRTALPVEFVGCDISLRAVEFARSRARQFDVNVDFYAADALNDPLPSGFDLMISSLFLHHLTDSEAGSLLAKMAATTKMILVSDLRRSWRGLWLAHAATRLLTRSAVVHVDGPCSVGNAFTVEEIRAIANHAGLQGVWLKNCWPQRYLLTWQRRGVPQ